MTQAERTRSAPAAAPAHPLRLFFRFALMRGTVLRALKVACVITPILTVLNHSREIVEGDFSLAFWAQVALTFLVPYGVSSYSSAMAAIAEHRRMGDDLDALSQASD